MDKSLFHFDLKSSAPTGTFSGYASVFGVVDLHGDRVLPGAFDTTLRESGGRIRVLAQHDTADVIGVARLRTDAHGLFVQGKLELDLQSARDAHVRLKAGLLDAMSIGYQTRKERFRHGVRELLDVELFEISLVTWPANPDARISDVKSHGDPAALAWAEFRDRLSAEAAPDAIQQIRRMKREARTIVGGLNDLAALRRRIERG